MLGKMKQVLIALFALLILAIAPSVLAMTVTVNDLDWADQPVSVQIGETMPIKVTQFADANYSDVVITAELSYNGKHVSEESKPIDMIEGSTYTRTLNLKMPDNIKVTDTGETYTLSIRMKDGKGNDVDWEQNFEVTVQKANDNVEIQKVMTTYANAGEPMIVTVVAKNIGSDSEDDVYVKVSIPELGLVSEERMGDIASVDSGDDEDVATADVPIRIPEDAESGIYTLKVEVYNDDEDVVVSATKSISINGAVPSEKFVEVVPIVASQDVGQGQTATYTLRVANLGDSTKTFSVIVEGTDGWATYQVNPLAVTLNADSSQMITVAIAAADKALIGEHKFTVKVKSDDAEKSVSLISNVKEASGIDTMLISVIVLAVVLVILIAVLVKTRKSGDEIAESEESYY